MTISDFSPEVTLNELRGHFLNGSLYPDCTRSVASAYNMWTEGNANSYNLRGGKIVHEDM